jgi:hypothetical protein
MERVIKIFSTNIRKVINSAAQTWGELQSDLRREGVSYSSMKAISSVDKISFEHPDATLPSGEFTLYLTPMKTKSGLAIYLKSQLEELVYELNQVTRKAEQLLNEADFSNEGWEKEAEEFQDILNKTEVDEDNDSDWL